VGDFARRHAAHVQLQLGLRIDITDRLFRYRGYRVPEGSRTDRRLQGMATCSRSTRRLAGALETA
jgi:hypothetical protein